MSIRATLYSLLRQSHIEDGSLQRRHPEDGLTIAIPNWNHEFLLVRSIHSALRTLAILKESGIKGEILINDDASRDGSVTLLRQMEALYGDVDLNVLIQHDNGGPAVSRNIMLTRARYRYILYLDADNEVIAENVPIFLQSIRDTQAAVVYGNLVIKNYTTDQTIGLHSNQSYTDHIYDANYIDNMALYDRIQITDMGGYAPENQPVEDWELFNHLAANGRLVVFVPALFGLYYELPQSLVRDIDQSHHLKLNARMKRVYDQFGMRKQQIMRTRHLRYHPDVGYII
ncbi:MAG: glycosyltransferase family 2 protein [Anaerolineae bacterium]|nr:glycosyltransferase family 2 protein [Anaerolineae bacterium]